MLSTLCSHNLRLGAQILRCQVLKQGDITTSYFACWRAHQICNQDTKQQNFVRHFSKKPDDYPNQVYYGVLTPQIRLIKVFSFGTSLTGLVMQPILYNQLQTMSTLPLVSKTSLSETNSFM